MVPRFLVVCLVCRLAVWVCAELPHDAAIVRAILALHQERLPNRIWPLIQGCGCV